MTLPRIKDRIARFYLLIIFMLKNNRLKRIGFFTSILLFSSIFAFLISTSALASEQKQNSFLENIVSFINTKEPTTPKVETPVDGRASRIDAYFAKYKMPLKGYGAKFIEVADKNGMDWRLLPAIAVQESTGGKHMCYNNPFGWGSCKIKFDSLEKAIEEVGLNLSGNDIATSRYYGGGKTIHQILWAYNGTVNSKYPGAVQNIMKKF